MANLPAIVKDRIVFKRPLYQKQRDAIFADERYSIVEASTKSGKTHACIQWLLIEALERGAPGRMFWWIAPTYAQAKIAFGRLTRSLPKDFIVKSNAYDFSVTLPNGAVIKHLSADKPDGLYGEDCYGAVLDEVTRMREESWFAVRSTLTATQSRARLIGNVKGRKNWAYRLARRAESGADGWHFARLTAYDAIDGGVLSTAEIEDAKATLPAGVFDELYLARPTEDTGNPFGIENIQKCIAPLSIAAPTVWGIDLAKSVDWTVIIGLDDSGHVAHFERWQSDWEATEQRIIAAIGNDPALIDSTGVGDPIFERLARVNSLAEGFKFSSTSKQQIMEGLAVAIQKREISFPAGVIADELEEFEYTYTRNGARYSAPDGLHDDAVCALALAVHKYRNKPSWGVW